MNHFYTRAQMFLLLCCLIGSLSSLRADVPFVNNFVDQGRNNAQVNVFDSSDEFPFFTAYQQSVLNQQYAGIVEMMDCFDVFTVGNDMAVAQFGDTITLIGLAQDLPLGTTTQGIWYVAGPGGFPEDAGQFLNTDGTPATEGVPPFGVPNTFISNFAGSPAADTILFIRAATDDALRSDYNIYFAAQGMNCTQIDSTLIRIDLAPNLTLDINAAGSNNVLVAGDPGNDAFSTAYCSGTMLEYSADAERNPTLSGKPVFVLLEVTDTSNALGYGALDGDTIYLPLNNVDIDTILENTGDEDIFVNVKMFPYYESDGTGTGPGSEFTPGVDVIGEMIEFEFLIYNEPIASFGGNDTICYNATVDLDFTGTPNTRVYYRDTLTMTLDSVDLNAMGRSVVTFPNVTTDLFFVIDSLRRLDPPFCTASSATIAGIAPQPFIVLDSIGATVSGVDTVACDTFGFVSFGFFANDSASVYSFTVTNSIDSTEVDFFANGEDTLTYDLSTINFDSVGGPLTVTFYIGNVVDTTSTANCANPIIQDSFVVFIDPDPIVLMTVAGGDDLYSDSNALVMDTFCITTPIAITAVEQTASASARVMFVRQIDSLYNLETNMVISVDTSYIMVTSDLTTNTVFTASNPDTLGLVRTILPYFESDSLTLPANYDDDNECAGDPIRLELILTPAPLLPTLTFASDTLCGGFGNDVGVAITGGTPGATVGYEIINEGVTDGVTNVTLDASGSSIFSYTPPIDSGTTIARLQFTTTECVRLLSQADTVFVKPQPMGTLSFAQDSICLTDTAYVIFNTPTTFTDSLNVRMRIFELGNASPLQTFNFNAADGDTIFSGVLPDDRVFLIERVRYPGTNDFRCNNGDDFLDTIYVDNLPMLQVDITEVGASPMTMGSPFTAPDMVYVEVCAGDSLYLDYSAPTVNDTSQFNDSLYVALTISDPLGTVLAAPGTQTFFLDIDSLAGYDSLFLENNTNDTARITIVAVPYFTGVDLMTGAPTTPFVDACKGDSLEIQIDVINNFVSTIGGNYEVCFGADTIVVITGPDFAIIDYQAIYETSPGIFDTSALRTDTLDGEGRFEIIIDSIIQDTIYDLVAARLPGSGCNANLGPNIIVTVVPPPMAEFANDTIMRCQGSEFDVMLVNGPISGLARVRDSLALDTFIVAFDAAGMGSFTVDSLVGDRKFYVDSVVFDNGMGLICVTDSIVDSIFIEEIPAPMVSLVSDTVCFGDTAYVTLATTSLDTFTVNIDSAGTDLTVAGVANGDKVLTIFGLTSDSLIVVLDSAYATTGAMCSALPTSMALDTVAVRIDFLPELFVAFSEPVVDTVSASSDFDTLIVCFDEILTDTLYTVPDTSVAGFGSLLSVVNANIRFGNGGPTFDVFSPGDVIPINLLQATMASLPPVPDSLILSFEVIPFFPTGTAFPMAYDPAVDCAGDTVDFTIIVLPVPMADFIFGMDTICENSTTDVTIVGNPGDTVLFVVEGFGTTNIVIPSDSTFEYMMPTVAEIDSAVLFETGMPNDDEIFFGVVTVNSATNPSCTNPFPDTDTLYIERLLDIDINIPDTTICFGSDLMVQFAGTNAAGATLIVNFDYTVDSLDAQDTIILNGMGVYDTLFTNFQDTLVITIDSIISGSSRMCLDTADVVSPVIRAVPLPIADFTPDTICNDGLLYGIFRYLGERTLTSMDSFEVVYDSLGTVTFDTVMNGDTLFVIDAEDVGPGSYTFLLQELTDLTTECDTIFPGMGIPQVFLIEEDPSFAVRFTGGVSNGVVFNTVMPFVFPNLGSTNVCSGTSLVTDLVGTADTSSMGDVVYARVQVFEDPFGVFGVTAPATIYLPLADLELSMVLVNNSTTIERLRFTWTAYFETEPGPGAMLDADECVGNSQIFNIRVYPNPVAEFVNMDTMRVCSGDSIYFKFSGTNGADVEFDDTDGDGPYFSSVGPNDSLLYVANQTGPDTIVFGITLVDITYPGIGQNCTNVPIDSVVLIINPLPDPFLEFVTNDTICFGETVEVVFRDTVGTAPWTVDLNGTIYTVAADGEILLTSPALFADFGYTIATLVDGNGCTPDTVFGGFVYTDTVRIDEIPLLSTQLELLDLGNISLGTQTLVDGLLEVDTFCALQQLLVTGITTTPSNLAGDPLYVQVEITGDVNAVWPMYAGDTTFVVNWNDLDDALDTPSIPNNTNTTIETQVILTPYFESNLMMPGISGDECTGAMDTFRLSIDPRPQANPVFYEFEQCSGETFTFALANSMVIDNFQLGTTFTYTTSTTGTGMFATPPAARPVGSDEPIEDELNNISNNRDTISYVITPLSPSGCAGADFTIEVIVRPEPVLVATSDTVCSGQESALFIDRDLNAINPQRYIVADVIYDTDMLTGVNVIAIGDTFDRTDNTDLGNGNDNQIIRDTFLNFSADTQRVDYVLVPFRLQTGCLGDTVTYSLFVAPEPLVMDRDTVVCTDVRLNIDLQATVDNGVASNFIWEVDSNDPFIEGISPSPVSGNFITDSLRLSAAAGTQQRRVTYLVTVLAENGCPVAGPNQFLYDVFISPNIELSVNTPQGDFICSGDPDGILIEADPSNTIGDVNYTWFIDGETAGVTSTNIINPTGNGSSINVNATGNGQFTLNLHVDDEGGCDAMTSLTITVYGDMVASFDTTYVGGSNTATVDFTDTSVGFPTQWLWNFGDPASGSSDTSMVQNPTHTFTAPGIYNVTLRVIRQAFCPDTAVITQDVFIGFVPQAKCDTIILYPGFNVISLDVDSSDNSVAAIFDEIINNEVSPGNSNLNQVIGIHPDQSSSPLIFTDFFQTLSTIRPGFGYAVNVDVQDTLIVCGNSIDPNLRVDLQMGMNIVGYVDEAPTQISSYFDSIITDNNLSLLQTYEMGIFQFWTPGFSTVTSVKNGLGYVLDVSSAYNGSQWRENGGHTSSNFEYLYGTTSLGSSVANYPVEVIDEVGNLLTTFHLDEVGDFGPAFLFGIVEDLNTHEQIGIPDGTEVRFRINGQVSTTSHVFNGGWDGTEMVIEFDGILQSTEESVYEMISFNVFPNPTRSVANLRINTAEQILSLQIELINATGQHVGMQTRELSAGTSNFELDVRELPAGVYLIRLIADGNYLGSDQLIIRR